MKVRSMHKNGWSLLACSHAFSASRKKALTVTTPPTKAVFSVSQIDDDPVRAATLVGTSEKRIN